MPELTPGTSCGRRRRRPRRGRAPPDRRLAHRRQAGGRPLEVRELPALLALLPRLGRACSTGRRSPASTSTYCKGCEICAEVCPVDAMTMVPEEVAS